MVSPKAAVQQDDCVRRAVALAGDTDGAIAAPETWRAPGDQGIRLANSL
jgi:hypothetical protein